MKAKYTLIHSFKDTAEVEIVADKNCPHGNAYFMPKYGENEFLIMLHETRLREKELNKWIRSYQNVLNGLNYWKCKAIEQKKEN